MTMQCKADARRGGPDASQLLTTTRLRKAACKLVKALWKQS